MNKCTYCGGNYTDDTRYCANCGTPTDPDELAREPRKSLGTAIVLILFFGPFGLLYLGIEGALAILVALGIAFVALPIMLLSIHNSAISVLIVLLSRVACIWWAANVINRRNQGSDDNIDARVLLDEATELEHADVPLAIAKYQEVIDRYPKSRPARIARTCLETLKPSSR